MLAVGLLTLFAKSTHQPLGQGSHQRTADQVRFDPQVQQPGHRTGRIVGVQCAEDKVPCQRCLDCHHGGVIHVDGYLYGANWEDNRNGNWVCQDWNTGKVMYEEKWGTKGSLLYADGMLYLYEEQRGNVGLVKATPEGFEVISSFRVKSGTGPHWAHPVIQDGILYMRHGDTLSAYKVRG